MLVGRVKNGAPAVYIGYGHGLYVDVREGDLMVGPWREADPSASEFPLPTVQEVNGAKVAMRTTQEPCALLLELANLTQPEDKPHATLTPLHRLHMKITACLARFREP